METKYHAYYTMTFADYALKILRHNHVLKFCLNRHPCIYSVIFINNLPFNVFICYTGMWHKAKRVQLQSGQSEVRVDFPLPIVACNLMMEYADFYENQQATGNLDFNIYLIYEINIYCRICIYQ